MIVFTLRELKRAWKQAESAFDESKNKTNAQRLLLFYAVETGLKAVILKRENQENSEGMFADTLHDLNKMLDKLRAGNDLRLPKYIPLVTKPPEQRKATCGELNQVWRYGAKAQNPTDTELEAKLSKINEWIKGELK